MTNDHAPLVNRQRPVTNDQRPTTDHVWESIYATSGRVFFEPFPRFPEVIQTFQEHGCRKILDLGCGSGRHVAGFAAAGFQTVGLDISPTGLAFTQTLLAENARAASGGDARINSSDDVRFTSPHDVEISDSNDVGISDSLPNLGRVGVGLVQADMLHPLPFRDASFHGLMSTQVIHHALKAQVLGIIDEIHRILAPGGIAIVSVPSQVHDDDDYEQIESNTFLPLTGSEAGLPHHYFDEETLAQAFSAFHIHFIDRRDSGRILMIQAQKSEQ
jgi:SAM-dependent methyltransferase